jgi:hypothetical protein
VTDRWRVTYYLRSGQTVVVYSSTEPSIENPGEAPGPYADNVELEAGDLKIRDEDVSAILVEPTKAPTSRRSDDGKVDVTSELFAVLEQQGAPIGQQRAQQLVKCGRGALVRAIEQMEAAGVLRRTSAGLELVTPPDPDEPPPVPEPHEILPPAPPQLGRVPATPLPGPPAPGPRLESEPPPHYSEVPTPQVGES